MKRTMGLDFGDRTIGVAVSDLLGITAQGIETIKRPNPIDLKDSIDRLGEIIKEQNVGKIVLGFPKNMNNTIGPRGEMTQKFKEKLEEIFNLPVILWDERLTTMEAERALIEGKVRRENRKKYIDKTAAIIILQSYLNSVV